MHPEHIAEHLLSIGAVKLSPREPFTWTSGIKSPIYCDNRMLYSHPEARSQVVDALASVVKSLHVEADVIAGTATAAIGWAALVADRLGLPFVYVRAKAKEHGAKKKIEELTQRIREIKSAKVPAEDVAELETELNQLKEQVEQESQSQGSALLKG
jgi:orotate phosphoribosyltransferase